MALNAFPENFGVIKQTKETKTVNFNDLNLNERGKRLEEKVITSLSVEYFIPRDTKVHNYFPVQPRMMKLAT